MIFGSTITKLTVDELLLVMTPGKPMKLEEIVGEFPFHEDVEVKAVLETAVKEEKVTLCPVRSGDLYVRNA